MRFACLSLTLAVLNQLPAAAADQQPSPFSQRGYYFTLSRMPTYGIAAWKQIVDRVQADGGNTIILWMGGGFRSKKFPETWEYNRDHANVRKDFVGELIDYAHTKKVEILLGFTPFGYDGVNRMSVKNPEWKATGPDGKPTRKFGFHSWGYNLCPARTDTQEFMFEYARELTRDFYPNADGLMIESSDYAACHCKDCGAKFYDHEFRFVKAISEHVWASKKDAQIYVYPHYFTGAKVPELGVNAAKQKFDPRWSLFYTPHSAHPDAKLTKQARGAVWSDDATIRSTPQAIREGARRAKSEKCTGYIPSFEVFTYVPTEPEEGQQYLVGTRRVPLGFGWLKDGRMPYDELPIRVNRIAYREFTRNPDLSIADFRTMLGKELFGKAATPESVTDVLTIQEVFAAERTWCQPAALASPERVKAMKAAGQLPERKRAEYRAALDRIREIELRYREKGEAFAELHRLARWVSDQWTGDTGRLIAP